MGLLVYMYIRRDAVKVYNISKHFNKDNFPMQIILVDEGRRVTNDVQLLSSVAEIINSQMGYQVFETNVKIASLSRAISRLDKRNLHVFHELSTTHRMRQHDNFDGPGRVLAHGEMPPGRVLCFDYSEKWCDTTYRCVAMHELGHVLGLEHNLDKDSLMYPVYCEKSRLGTQDIEHLRQLYPFMRPG